MNGETIMSAMNYIDSDILYNTEQIRNGKEKIIPGWDTPASDVANSILLGYKLSGSDSLSEW